jgi:hypothetical protein
MNEIHINYMLKNNRFTSSTFRGVFAADEVKSLEPNGHYVINLDTRKYSGSHWILITRDMSGHVHYFCSSGDPPFELNILKLLDHYHPQVHYSTRAIQSVDPRSRSCGLYCILISYLMSRDWTLCESTTIFTNDPWLNEIILHRTLKVCFEDELF